MALTAEDGDDDAATPSTSTAARYRLIDYFAVIDCERTPNGRYVGKIVQRFPVTDRTDTPFFNGLEVFCQPPGWHAVSEHRQPLFFVGALTDVDGARHYAASMSVLERARSSSELEDDTTETADDAAADAALGLYTPKCLVLISKHDCLDTFRLCLNAIYTAHIDRPSLKVKQPPTLEQMVASVLSGLYMPTSNSGSLTAEFSLGVGDRQSIRARRSHMIPATGCAVALLFKQLGTIHNLLCVFCAVLTDCHILFHSLSYRRLSDACHALTALLYPLKYNHVFVPVLPESALEVLETPTPFIMGVHSSLKPKLVDLADVITVDLDTGTVYIPVNADVPALPEPFGGRFVRYLTTILNSDLYRSDEAFADADRSSKTSTPTCSLPMLDKQIRAAFVRLFAELLADYRCCLQIVRLHPHSFVSFHKSAFLGVRGLQDDVFMSRLLTGMHFQQFITERGLPHRSCDLFDQISATINDTLRAEMDKPELLSVNLLAIAEELRANEQPAGMRAPVEVHPSATALSNPAPAAFPLLDVDRIAQLMNDRDAKHPPPKPNAASQQRTDVPAQTYATLTTGAASLSSANMRRLAVLRSCLRCVFDNRITDARKMLPAVLLSMKNQAARVAFCQELHLNLCPSNRATLEPQQFDLIVRLMNSALENEGPTDAHGIAYALLRLANTYCRRLTPGILQFAYTCIQEHAVWANFEFWESIFYHDVHQRIRQLYLSADQAQAEKVQRESVAEQPFGLPFAADTWHLLQSPSALDVAAAELKTKAGGLSADQLANNRQQELDIIRSQAVLYTTYMTCMRTPLDAQKLRHVNVGDLEARSANVMSRPALLAVAGAGSQRTASSAGEDDELDEEEDVSSDVGSDVESGFVDTHSSPFHYIAQQGGAGGGTDLGQSTVRFVCKFLDKVCTEAGLDAPLVAHLQQRVPGFVGAHVEDLEQVHRESKRLPPIHKPKLLVPSLLPDERVVLDQLRVYLLADGRCMEPYPVRSKHADSDGCMDECALLPAEGALLITNYRIIFKGQPCDPFVCEQVVMRCLPILSVIKEKRLGALPILDPRQASSQATTLADAKLQRPHEHMQIRSAAFQLMRIAFDEEVSVEQIDQVSTLLEQLRWPESSLELFPIARRYARGGGLAVNSTTTIGAGAGTGGTLLPGQTAPKKANTLSGMLKSAKRAAGLRPMANKQQQQQRGGTLTADSQPVAPPRSLSRTLKHLTDLVYVVDWQRLALLADTTAGNSGSSGSETSRFRLCTVNRTYRLCTSYPAAFVVPAVCTDESLKKVARSHRHARLPVVVWASSRGALLLRASAFQPKGAISRTTKAVAKGFQQAQDLIESSSASGPQSVVALKSAVEHQRYLAAIVQLSPTGAGLGAQQSSSSAQLTASMGSLLSLDSLMLTSLDAASTGSTTPELHRRAGAGLPFASRIRASAGKAPTKSMAMSGRFGGFRTASGGGHSTTLLQPPGGPSTGSTTTTTADSATAVAMTAQHHRRMSSSSTLATPGSRMQASKRISSSGMLTAHPWTAQAPQSLNRASLYLLGDKQQSKSLKLPPKCECIPIGFPSAHDMKQAFTKFLRVVVPSTPEPNQTPGANTGSSSGALMLKQLDETGWLQLVRYILQTCGAIVDLIDIQNSSVAICLEDGWDVTCQLTSIAQILLDPHYRTLDGFRVLLEKEWLAFGHRFGHRANHTVDSARSGHAPVFGLFLDAVHQIHAQFPGAFEFNDFLLRFIAYHSLAGYFNTFVLDSECERLAAGLLDEQETTGGRNAKRTQSADDTLNETSASAAGGGLPARKPSPAGGAAANFDDMWKYIQNRHARSSLFYNFLYVPDLHDVLRPQTHLCSLDVWLYYTDDTLAHGPVYDLESAECEQQQRAADRTDQSDVTDIGRGKRRLIDEAYDSVPHCVPTGPRNILEEMEQLERDLDQTPAPWATKVANCRSNARSVHNKTPKHLDVWQESSVAVQFDRWLQRALHKKFTIELLLRGSVQHTSSGGGGLKYTGSAQGAAHTFTAHHFITPAKCEVCHRQIWDTVGQPGVRCSECGCVCHVPCSQAAAAGCLRQQQYPAAITGSAKAPSSSGVETASTVTDTTRDSQSSSATTHHTHSISEVNEDERQQAEHLLLRQLPETRSHQGYLQKRGAGLVKVWNTRWFVLDIPRHQLRYYESPHDDEPRGHIDLGQVHSVGPVPTPGAHNKGCLFDIRTHGRVFSLLAYSKLECDEWVENLQSCLQ